MISVSRVAASQELDRLSPDCVACEPGACALAGRNAGPESPWRFSYPHTAPVRYGHFRYRPAGAARAQICARELLRHPVIAWNGSLEATRAVAGALPLLRAAEQV